MDTESGSSPQPGSQDEDESLASRLERCTYRSLIPELYASFDEDGALLPLDQQDGQLQHERGVFIEFGWTHVQVDLLS